jgi:hypothetical protein
MCQFRGDPKHIVTKSLDITNGKAVNYLRVGAQMGGSHRPTARMRGAMTVAAGVRR